MGKRNKYVDFVSDEPFLNCVKYVCGAYPSGDSEVILKKFTKNSLDLFKTIFDIVVGKLDFEKWKKSEEIRQADKTISNKVGDFHQMLLGGVEGWEDLKRGHPLGIDLKKEDDSVFIELKNKHNTVKGEDLENVFDKLKKVAEQYSNAIVYYAYIIPKRDIHVHHKNENKPDNRRNNLEVLHKDDHAKRHSFDTWEKYQKWKKTGFKSSRINKGNIPKDTKSKQTTLWVLKGFNN